jgi:multiple sugar transport system ATP-binding protein
MIAGLEIPTSGRVWIGGHDVTPLTPRERRIAMVFQSYALYPHLSVYQNIAFPLKAQKVPKQQHKQKVEWAAGLLGIGHLLKRRPRELSGGERQRVALARAMVRNPTVFLLDEPLSNLDAKLRASAREEIENFQKRVGTTTIYVTHDQVEAMAMGDRVAVLNKGVVRQIGTPRQVYEEPADTFVATFLGSPPMNLLEHDGVVVGFRPEHFRPAGVALPGVRIPFRFRLNLMEYLGSETILYGALEGGRFNGKAVISRLPATIAGGVPAESDRVYDFAVAEPDLKFFDRETEVRTQPRPLTWQ